MNLVVEAPIVIVTGGNMARSIMQRIITVVTLARNDQTETIDIVPLLDLLRHPEVMSRYLSLYGINHLRRFRGLSHIVLEPRPQHLRLRRRPLLSLLAKGPSGLLN